MNEQALNKLDFPRLLNLISTRLHSLISKKRLMDMMPLSSIDEINKRSRQIEEIRRSRQSGRTVELEDFIDILPVIKKVMPEGAILDGLELYSFIPVLSNISETVHLTEDQKEFPYLSMITEEMTLYPNLLLQLRRAVDSEGQILDTASPRLKDIRSQIKNLEGRIRKRLEDIVQSENVSIFLQDNFVTQRSGRWVIPVRMDSKGQVSGVVHDVSKSGETAFIEPLSIISLTNELENLRADEKAEEIRILREFAHKIRTESEGLARGFEALIYFDILNGIALYADSMNMQPPVISGSMEIKLFNARHPLLYHNLHKRGLEGTLVPLDLRVDSDMPVLVITGPNAGGKTIVLKTLGLLTLMALCGMPVPASSMSSFPLLNNILADIGDEQSIDDSLSTFAGHISNLSRFISEAHRGTMILIDELGTGTDPVEGAALASAILKELRGTGSLVIANTHLSDIKGFVHRSEGMLNASMQFDPKDFKPLFRLSIGLPGQSYAFETALRYNLPERVVHSARELLGSQKIELDSLIGEMQGKKQEYERLSIQLKDRLRELELEREKVTALQREAEDLKKETLRNACDEASALISGLRDEIFQMLEAAKKQDKSQLKASIKTTEKMARQIRERQRAVEPAKSSETIDIKGLRQGDRVFSISADADVEIIHINERQERLKIRVKGIEFDVPIDDIALPKEKTKTDSEVNIGIVKDSETSINSLNIIGKRVDEAISELEPFLNHVFLSGLSEALIIHGVGTGILRKAVHEHLRGHHLVKTFRSGNPSEGGPGATVITFV